MHDPTDELQIGKTGWNTCHEQPIKCDIPSEMGPFLVRKVVTTTKHSYKQTNKQTNKRLTQNLLLQGPAPSTQTGISPSPASKTLRRKSLFPQGLKSSTSYRDCSPPQDRASSLSPLDKNRVMRKPPSLLHTGLRPSPLTGIAPFPT